MPVKVTRLACALRRRVVGDPVCSADIEAKGIRGQAETLRLFERKIKSQWSQELNANHSYTNHQIMLPLMTVINFFR